MTSIRKKCYKKVYPGRQVEYNNSSQQKIDHRIRGVNNETMRRLKRNKTLPKMTAKTENETQECDFKIKEHNRNDEEHEQNKKDNEIEKDKNGEPENNKEE